MRRNGPVISGQASSITTGVNSTLTTPKHGKMRSNRAMGCSRRSPFLSSRTQVWSPAAAEFISRLSLRLVAGALSLACIPGFLWAQQGFLLKDGDTVVFYGDSITE